MDPDWYGIVRMERPANGTFGWQVRLQRRGVKFAKYFADRGFGGPEAALTAARSWRDEVMRQCAVDDRARICQRSARNSSGVVGVSKITVIGANGASYFFWQATWYRATGERAMVRFSVKRFGEKQAFKLAVLARREGTGL